MLRHIAPAITTLLTPYLIRAADPLSLPFLIAAYRKLKALSMLLAEMGVTPEKAGRHTARVRKVIAEVIPLLSLLVIMLLMALSASILPTLELLVLADPCAFADADRPDGSPGAGPGPASPLKPAGCCAQLASQTSRAQCQTESQLSSVSSPSSPSHSTTSPSPSTR